VVQRLAEVPGLGVSSAVQIAAEVGPQAEAFGCAKELSSWVGVCPGSEESGGSRKVRAHPRVTGTRRLLIQAAQAAVKMKGGIFEITFRKLVPRLG
jgi:transposase